MPEDLCQFNRDVLENGIEIFHHKIPGKITHFRLLSRAGARYDPPGKEGLAHLLEHIALVGGFPDFSSFLKHSAYLNAKTSAESLVFEVQTFTKNIADMLQKSSGCFNVPQLDNIILERERKIIFNEIDLKFYRPDVVCAAKKYFKILYGRHPWSRMINLTGIPDSLLSIETGDLRKYQQSFFVQPNLAVLVASPLELKEIKAMVQENLTAPQGKKPPGTAPLNDFPKPETNFITLYENINPESKNFESKKTVIVFSAVIPSLQVPANTSPIRAALRMAILEKLRSGECSAYDVEVALCRMRDICSLTISTNISQEKEEKAIKLIREAISSFGKDAKLFDMAKLETLFYLELEKTDYTVSKKLDVAEFELAVYDEPRKLQAEIDFVEKMSFKETAEWVDRWLAPERILVCVSKF